MKLPFRPPKHLAFYAGSEAAYGDLLCCKATGKIHSPAPPHEVLSSEALSAHREAFYAAYPEMRALGEGPPGYDFDEAFPEPTRAHIVIDGEVSDAKALRDAARQYSAEALGYIVTVMRYSRDEKVKLTAADLILNRAVGKPVAPTGVMEGNELKEALGSIVLPEKRKIKDVKMEPKGLQITPGRAT